MPHETVEWVGLTEVIAAAERGLAPLGPELAGFLVLEAALRIRDGGGGVIDARSLVVDALGQVHLTKPPRRADERRATGAVRSLLQSLLEVATGSTPALRRCARTKDDTGLAQVVRELEGALIPLNRAASRRGVARVAKATLEAIESGVLARDESSSPPPDAVSDSPPAARATAAATRAMAPAPVAPAAPDVPTVPEATPTPVDLAPMQARMPAAIPEPTPEPAPTTTVTLDPAAGETTPFVAPGQWIRPVGTPPPPLGALGALGTVASLAEQLESALSDASGGLLSDADAQDAFEVVSSLPPVVGPVASSAAPVDAWSASDEDSPRDGFAVSLPTPAPAGPVVRRRDRVDALVAGFRVSRLRDDPSLAYDLKAMVGIETSVPPQVGLRPASASSPHSMPGIEIAIDTDDSPSRVDVETPHLPRFARRERRGARGALLAMTLLTVGLALGAVSRTPSMRAAVARWIAPLAPPPGDGPAPARAPAVPAAMPVARLPNVCEAKLELLGLPSGAEVVRRLGAAPLTVAVAAHVPLDLVAIAGGATPRRAHVDPSAPWQVAPTGARLELPITLDAGKDAGWPARPTGWSAQTGTGPASAGARGLLHVTTNPAGASLWLGVDPAAITGLPCGAGVDLQVIVPPAAPKPVHVDWSAFAGAPPHAAIKP